LPGKIAIEQYLAFQTMHSHRRAQRLVDVVDSGKREPGAAAAKENRRDDHVQAIEAAGFQKPRQRVGATLDEHAAQSHLGKTRENIRRLDMAVVRRQGKNIDVVTRAARSARRHDDAAHAVIGEQASSRRKAATRIDDDARRSWPGDMANRQLRIICDRAAHANDYRVDQGAKPMQMRQAGRPVDIARMSGLGRGAAVERLSNLANDDQVVDRPDAQWPEHIFKRRRHCFSQTPKYFGNHPPRRCEILDFRVKGPR
jgi:glycosyltransferase 2 family protein